MITESEELAAALDQASVKWPDVSSQRTELLRKLIALGVQSLNQDLDEKAQARLTAVNQVAGSMTNSFPSNWRERQLADWSD